MFFVLWALALLLLLVPWAEMLLRSFLSSLEDSGARMWPSLSLAGAERKGRGAVAGCLGA